MEYMSWPEAGKKWGLPERRIQIFCKESKKDGFADI